MTQIAIVDDRADDREQLRIGLERECARRAQNWRFTEFTSGEAFLDTFTQGSFAAVFLDIYMDGLTGVDVARTLYREDPKCRIVFLTTSLEHILESYEVRATYYLTKPFEEARLQQALDFCFPAHDACDTLVIHARTGTVVAPRNNITYIEHVGRYTYVHLTDRTLESAENFSEVTAPLSDDTRFLACARGVLIHMGHVRAQEGGCFIMNDGTHYSISRRGRAELIRVFQDFAVRRMQGELL